MGLALGYRWFISWDSLALETGLAFSYRFYIMGLAPTGPRLTQNAMRLRFAQFASSPDV